MMMVMIGDSNQYRAFHFLKIKLESIPHFQFFNYSRNDIMMMVSGDDGDEIEIEIEKRMKPM